jgi:hypothetical protein
LCVFGFTSNAISFVLAFRPQSPDIRGVRMTRSMLSDWFDVLVRTIKGLIKEASKTDSANWTLQDLLHYQYGPIRPLQHFWKEGPSSRHRFNPLFQHCPLSSGNDITQINGKHNVIYSHFSQLPPDHLNDGIVFLTLTLTLTHRRGLFTDLTTLPWVFAPTE